MSEQDDISPTESAAPAEPTEAPEPAATAASGRPPRKRVRARPVAASKAAAPAAPIPEVASEPGPEPAELAAETASPDGRASE
jgi:hypothetical protein